MRPDGVEVVQPAIDDDLHLAYVEDEFAVEIRRTWRPGEGHIRAPHSVIYSKAADGMLA